jgi:hypothetical protein
MGESFSTHPRLTAEAEMALFGGEMVKTEKSFRKPGSNEDLLFLQLIWHSQGTTNQPDEVRFQRITDCETLRTYLSPADKRPSWKSHSVVAIAGPLLIFAGLRLS